jgi:pimeloyl-ACP methyl ester carboxylesterase
MTEEPIATSADTGAAGAGGGGTIVLIHGLWLTPLGWEEWVDRYTKLGYQVLAPAWPGMEVGVEALNADPSVMNGLGVTEVADHYEQIIRGLDTTPIIMGHSFGGLVTEILLDRGLGSAGVAIHPAPAKGVLRLPASALKSGFPVLSNPANRSRTVALSPEQFHYSFTNTLGTKESRPVYDRYHVPAPGRPLFQAATANLNPNAATKVNFRNDQRAPLLLLAGSSDNTVPASMVREAHKRYGKSSALADYKEFPGRPHFTMGVPGWEEVADYALNWAAEHHSSTNPTSPG